MAGQSSHVRLLTFPADRSPQGGRLGALHLQTPGKPSDLLMDYHELKFSAPPTLVEVDGKPWERVQGVYQPRRLRFVNSQIVNGGELCAYFDNLPLDHPSRDLTGALAWRAPDGQNLYLFWVHGEGLPLLMLNAQDCLDQERSGPNQVVTLTRDWSPPPPSPARLLPNPKRLHQRFGGDPIAIRLNEHIFQRRLFIGGVDVQGEQRPEVQVVFNVGEEASRWSATTQLCSTDRWENKGEGSAGMDIHEIAEEAQWVIQRLQAGQRVLVHCAGGMNRSATICCAVLILLEGVSAETALARVREHHPWARPDSHHWLALRWLADTAKTFTPQGPE